MNYTDFNSQITKFIITVNNKKVSSNCSTYFGIEIYTSEKKFEFAAIIATTIYWLVVFCIVILLKCNPKTLTNIKYAIQDTGVKTELMK